MRAITEKPSPIKSKQKTVKRPLWFLDGKARTVPKVLAFMPAFKEFREPIIGVGSFFLNLNERFPERVFWINDLNRDLFSFWLSC